MIWNWLQTVLAACGTVIHNNIYWSRTSNDCCKEHYMTNLKRGHFTGAIQVIFTQGMLQAESAICNQYYIALYHLSQTEITPISTVQENISVSQKRDSKYITNQIWNIHPQYQTFSDVHSNYQASVINHSSHQKLLYFPISFALSFADHNSYFITSW